MKPRLSRADWLDLGLSALATRGTEAVKLDAICKAAGVTKGSFYHHFGSHKAFLVDLATHWRDTQTRALLPQLEGLTPDDLSEKLNELAYSLDYRVELGIRELARRRADVAEIVEAADAERRTAMLPAYQARFGCDAKLAAQLATLDYAAFAGSYLLNPNITPPEQRVLADLFEAMVRAYLADGGRP